MDTPPDQHGNARGSLAALGYGLGVISILAAFALLHHPVSHGQQSTEILASIRLQTRTDEVVHATLAMVFGVLAAAMVLFAERLGFRRFTVVLGLVAFLCAFILTVLAAMTDGFVIPAIAARGAADPAATCVSEAVSMARLSALHIEYLTRFSFVSVAIAVASWSVALIGTRDVPRWAGLIGLASSGCQIAALLAESQRLAPSSLLVIFSSQMAWYLLVASLMIRQDGPFAASVTAGRRSGAPRRS